MANEVGPAYRAEKQIHSHTDFHRDETAPFVRVEAVVGPMDRNGGTRGSGRNHTEGPVQVQVQAKIFPTGKSAAPCRYFNLRGGCRFGDACEFGHFREGNASVFTTNDALPLPLNLIVPGSNTHGPFGHQNNPHSNGDNGIFVYAGEHAGGQMQVFGQSQNQIQNQSQRASFGGDHRQEDNYSVTRDYSNNEMQIDVGAQYGTGMDSDFTRQHHDQQSQEQGGQAYHPNHDNLIYQQQEQQQQDQHQHHFSDVYVPSFEPQQPSFTDRNAYFDGPARTVHHTEYHPSHDNGDFNSSDGRADYQFNQFNHPDQQHHQQANMSTGNEVSQQNYYDQGVDMRQSDDQYGSHLAPQYQQQQSQQSHQYDQQQQQQQQQYWPESLDSSSHNDQGRQTNRPWNGSTDSSPTFQGHRNTHQGPSNGSGSGPAFHR